ncbi:hypothetical protein DPMN_001229 [Dreissena polymorpha]|uniref:Uncharacterized protein n=1 Tax=Dreissena polymorpha TaxID=45954 RepID=A0A9D4RQ70_DREPO|nr:hypothetical protein DPMN_001229 [Dreissena polymorpha]
MVKSKNPYITILLQGCLFWFWKTLQPRMQLQVVLLLMMMVMVQAEGLMVLEMFQ